MLVVASVKLQVLVQDFQRGGFVVGGRDIPSRKWVESRPLTAHRKRLGRVIGFSMVTYGYLIILAMKGCNLTFCYVQRGGGGNLKDFVEVSPPLGKIFMHSF